MSHDKLVNNLAAEDMSVINVFVVLKDRTQRHCGIRLDLSLMQ